MPATQEEVWAAAEAIRSQGEKPTLDKVRMFLGGGSPNAIHPHFKAWKVKQRQAAEQPQEAAEAGEGALVVHQFPQIVAAMDGLQAAIRSTVQTVEDRERHQARQAIDALTDQLRQVQAQAKEEIDALTADLETMSEEQTATARDRDQAQKSLEATTADRDRLAEDLATRTADRDRMAQRIELLERDLASATKERDAERARAEESEDEVRTLKGTLDTLNSDLKETRQVLEASHAKEAEAREQAARATQLADQRDAEVQAARSQVESFRQDRERALVEAKEARQAEAMARERAAGLEAQIDAARTNAEAAERRAAEALSQLTQLAAAVRPEAPSEATPEAPSRGGKGKRQQG